MRKHARNPRAGDLIRVLAWAIGWSSAAAAEEITLAQALTYALEGNLELERARLARRDAVYDIQSAAGVFDPSVAAGVRVSGARTPTNAVVDGSSFVNSSSTSWNVGLAQQLPTGGSVSATWSEGAFRSDSANSAIPASYTSSLSVSLAHPLLRGAGTVAVSSSVAHRPLWHYRHHGHTHPHAPPCTARQRTLVHGRP